MRNSFDVIVVGAGHAGCEAALACARMGHETLVLCLNLDTVAAMSCNPAIGGLAKGHLVREIDALGGVMGRAADAAGIQFKMLNTSKGPAVQAPRAQCDKFLYRSWVKRLLEKTPRLALKQGQVESLVIDQDWPPNETGDVRVVLFVKLQDGMTLDSTLIDKVKQHIRANTTPRHVPAKVVQVADIPRTKSGKIVELAVRDVVHGRPVANTEALANPEALDAFRDLEELRT